MTVMIITKQMRTNQSKHLYIVQTLEFIYISIIYYDKVQEKSTLTLKKIILIIFLINFIK